MLYLPQGHEALAGIQFNAASSRPATVGGGFRQFQRMSALSTVVETQRRRPTIADDRDVITAEDKVVLIVEDDQAFAPVLLDVARQKGFRGIVTSRGDAAVSLAHRYRPDAITLDIQLEETTGWRVLDRLKHDPATRHIPVHIISVADERQRALRQGAFAHLTKPVTREALDATFTNIRAFIERRVKNLLVVEDDDIERSSIVELIGNDDVHVTAVATGQEALDAIERETFDCMVLDLGLSDMSGFELLEELRARGRLVQLPVIVYTAKELSKAEETELRRVAETIIVKDVKSPDRLLDETSLFLHRIQENLPEAKRRMLEQLRHADPALAGRTVLIVDDDVRNTFALASALEQYQMQVVPAENGTDGIEILKSRPGIDVVLMDVMMPEMDGYEATRAIRALPQFRNLPIIALTAKAMKGDRDLCIEAGASDYITKPVDTDQLISLLRVWLYQLSRGRDDVDAAGGPELHRGGRSRPPAGSRLPHSRLRFPRLREGVAAAADSEPADGGEGRHDHAPARQNPARRRRAWTGSSWASPSTSARCSGTPASSVRCGSRCSPCCARRRTSGSGRPVARGAKRSTHSPSCSRRRGSSIAAGSTPPTSTSGFWTRRARESTRSS